VFSQEGDMAFLSAGERGIARLVPVGGTVESEREYGVDVVVFRKA